MDDDIIIDDVDETIKSNTNGVVLPIDNLSKEQLIEMIINRRHILQNLKDELNKFVTKNEAIDKSDQITIEI